MKKIITKVYKPSELLEINPEVAERLFSRYLDDIPWILNSATNAYKEAQTVLLKRGYQLSIFGIKNEIHFSGLLSVEEWVSFSGHQTCCNEVEEFMEISRCDIKLVYNGKANVLFLFPTSTAVGVTELELMSKIQKSILKEIDDITDEIHLGLRRRYQERFNLEYVTKRLDKENWYFTESGTKYVE